MPLEHKDNDNQCEHQSRRRLHGPTTPTHEANTTNESDRVGSLNSNRPLWQASERGKENGKHKPDLTPKVEEKLQFLCSLKKKRILNNCLFQFCVCKLVSLCIFFSATKYNISSII